MIGGFIFLILNYLIDMSDTPATIVLTYEEKTIADIITNTPELAGVTYVIAKTGDDLQSDTEKENRSS